MVHSVFIHSKYVLECIRIYAADVISLQHFKATKNIGRIWVNSLPTGLFCMLFCPLLMFFKINFFEKFFQEYHQSVKQFGSSSGQTFCQA